MKTNTITRQTIYLSVATIFLFIFVFVFSFSALIPEGKTYRIKKNELKKENVELQKYQEFNNETLERLKKLQGDNAHIITAFKASFNIEQFEKSNKIYFNSLSISEKIKVENEEEFSVYEVNTTSKINSPKVFYDFLDAINKSDAQIIEAPRRAGDPAFLCADVSLAATELGFKSKYSLEESIRSLF